MNLKKYLKEINEAKSTTEEVREGLKNLDPKTYSKLKDHYFGIADNVDEFYDTLKKAIKKDRAKFQGLQNALIAANQLRSSWSSLKAMIGMYL